MAFLMESDAVVRFVITLILFQLLGIEIPACVCCHPVPPPFFCRDVSVDKKLRMAQKIMTFEAKVTCFNTHGTGLASM